MSCLLHGASCVGLQSEEGGVKLLLSSCCRRRRGGIRAASLLHRVQVVVHGDELLIDVIKVLAEAGNELVDHGLGAF